MFLLQQTECIIFCQTPAFQLTAKQPITHLQLENSFEDDLRTKLELFFLSENFLVSKFLFELEIT